MPILFNAIQPAAASKRDQFILVFGAKSDLSFQLARDLRSRGERVKFIEPNPSLVDQAEERDYEVIPAEVTEETIRQIGAEKIRHFLVLGTTDETNLSASKAAICAGVESVVAMVNQPALIPEFRGIGVKPFSPAVYRTAMLSLLVRNPDLFNLVTTTTDEQDIREMQLANPALDGKRVRHLQFSGDMLIVSISRNGELLIPHGNMRVYLGDRMTVLGSVASLQEAQSLLAG
jgi:CPA2 family monovalent cation:H+ antiporter-2/trk system potassium uptake protein TrkA